MIRRTAVNNLHFHQIVFIDGEHGRVGKQLASHRERISECAVIEAELLVEWPSLTWSVELLPWV